MFSGGTGRGDRTLAFVSPGIPSSIFTGGNGRGDRTMSYVLPKDLLLIARALLEGPFDGIFEMNDTLRVQGLIPLAEPYTALGFAQVGSGGETVSPAVLAAQPNGSVVDWIFVELRSSADPSIVVATRNALLLQNGLIVDTDGTSPVTFQDLPPGQYHIAVRHRNHLGIMSLFPQELSTVSSYVDFTLPYTPTYGVDAQKDLFFTKVLWAGDVNHDGMIKYTGGGNNANDRDPILTTIGGVVPTNSVTGYKQEDVNMDGTVKYTGLANDRDVILQNIGGVVPTNTRVEQLP